jgi:uncharacterized protein with von Willebrand factor type A (vWA) domain
VGVTDLAPADGAPADGAPADGAPADGAVADRAQPDLATLATAFARSARAAGLDAPPSAAIDFAEALGVLGTADPQAVFTSGQACFCRGPEDLERYAQVFLAFFRTPAHHPPVRLPPPPPPPALVVVTPSDAGEEDEPEEPETSDSTDRAVGAYSALEILRRKDFAACSEEELAEIGRLIAELRRRPPRRRRRRTVASRHSERGRLDVRATVRASLRSGAELQQLHRRRHGETERRVVWLLDVSGSMRPYAREMLRVAHGSVVAHRRAEAFTLSTRCTRVTRELGLRDPDAALEHAAAAAPDIEGGTRLGEGLRAFNDTWGVRGLARGAVVVVCSDGWDRGDPAVLGDEMARLSRVAERIVWVNPLKATEGYEPLARGMAAALPYVDEFCAGNSLDALGELVEVIAR